MPVPPWPSSAGQRVQRVGERVELRGRARAAPTARAGAPAAAGPAARLASGSNAPVDDRAAGDDRLVAVVRVRRVELVDLLLGVSPLASSAARSISSCMLPRRSQAIALSQASESTGVHCSTA